MNSKLEELEQELQQIEKQKNKSETTDDLAQALKRYQGEDKVISFKDYLKSKKNRPPYFSSGISLLDDLIEGFHEEDLVTITAPTGQGKTSFCQCLINNFSQQKIRSLLFSYEDSMENILKKFGDEIPDGYTPKVLTDRNLTWIERKIVEGIVKYDIQVVFIDHLHYLFNMETVGNYSLVIGQIMRSLKIICKKYGITIFVVAHTKMIREDDIIGLESIRDSSFIGQESDYVIALWRIREKQRRVDIKNEGIQYTNETMINIVKNRHTGNIGSFKVVYNSLKFIPVEIKYKNDEFEEDSEDSLSEL
jgi:replicative DNA helicase